MNQSRLGSFYEAIANLVIGFAINYIANIYLIPMFATGADGRPAVLSYSANWWMGCAYTAVSLVRQFVLRRYFNARLHAAAMRLAGDRRP
jgi:hypothetical protein